jgi:hypothetical protein
VDSIGARYRKGDAWTPEHRERMLSELEEWPEFKEGRLCAVPHTMHKDVIYLNDNTDDLAAHADHPHSHNDAKYAPGGVPTGAPSRKAFAHGDIINFRPECDPEGQSSEGAADESAWQRKCWLWMRVLTSTGVETEDGQWPTGALR